MFSPFPCLRESTWNGYQLCIFLTITDRQDVQFLMTLILILLANRGTERTLYIASVLFIPLPRNLSQRSFDLSTFLAPPLTNTTEYRPQPKATHFLLISKSTRNKTNKVKCSNRTRFSIQLCMSLPRHNKIIAPVLSISITGITLMYHWLKVAHRLHGVAQSRTKVARKLHMV